MLTLQKTMEKRHNDVAGLDCASALRPLTLGTGADLAQSAYTRVMQEVRVRKNTEAVLKSKKKNLCRLNPPLLKFSGMT